MEVTNEAYEALIKYFESLTHIGYKSYSEVYQLLSFLFIEEILCGPMAEFITDNDYKDITNAVYCLYGSNCMISYPSYLEGRTRINTKVLDSYRITETDILRNSDSHLRTLA